MQTTHAAPTTFHVIAALIGFIRAYKTAGFRPEGETICRGSYLTWTDTGLDLAPPQAGMGKKYSLYVFNVGIKLK